jgi:transcriptional regulator GlxA family with amidase domain
MTKAMQISPAMGQPASPAAPCRYVLLLLPSFSGFDLSGVMQALREANGFDSAPRYELLPVSEDGQPVEDANGLPVAVSGSLFPLSRRDTVLIFGGKGFKSASTLPVLSWLRREARKGAAFGAIGSGAFTLAKAGLLNGKRASAHWAYRAAIAESCPDLEISRSIYTLESGRYTCAGGVSSVDLALALIAQDWGPEVSQFVADRMICSAPRTGQHDQTVSVQWRAGIRHEKLAAAMQCMLGEYEDPLSPAEIAAKVSISTRQLERLFAKYLNASPKSYYTKLRLENARSMLQQTDMRIVEIALANGFSSQGHFSKAYKKHFGESPNQERRRAAAAVTAL